MQVARNDAAAKNERGRPGRADDPDVTMGVPIDSGYRHGLPPKAAEVAAALMVEAPSMAVTGIYRSPAPTSSISSAQCGPVLPGGVPAFAETTHIVQPGSTRSLEYWTSRLDIDSGCAMAAPPGIRLCVDGVAVRRLGPQIRPIVTMRFHPGDILADAER